jgi:hypothetical protein
MRLAIRHERTAYAARLASSCNIERTRRVKPFISPLIQSSERRHATSIDSSLAPAAQRLTLELTGRADNAEIIQVLDERQANSRSGSMSC